MGRNLCDGRQPSLLIGCPGLKGIHRDSRQNGQPTVPATDAQGESAKISGVLEAAQAVSPGRATRAHERFTLVASLRQALAPPPKRAADSPVRPPSRHDVPPRRRAELRDAQEQKGTPGRAVEPPCSPPDPATPSSSSSGPARRRCSRPDRCGNRRSGSSTSVHATTYCHK